MIDKYKDLMNKYDKLFIQKDLDKTQTCMCWGIDCGEGWYPILEALCEKLQWDTDNNNYPQVEFTQIKEKYGRLTIYFTAPACDTTDEYYDDQKFAFQEGVIDMAEKMSCKVCEECGSMKEVTVGGVGWIKTLCRECRANDN